MKNLYHIDNFDWEIYLLCNPDLKKSNINTKSQALNHFKTNGINENRFINTTLLQIYYTYDWITYKKKYKKIQNLSYTACYFYYIKKGILEKDNIQIKQVNDNDMINFFIKDRNNLKYYYLLNQYNWSLYREKYNLNHLNSDFDGFLHYIKHGKGNNHTIEKNLIPITFFNSSFYQEINNINNSKHLLKRFIIEEDFKIFYTKIEEKIFEIYDWKKYLNDNQDLKNANINDNYNAFKHFIKNGINEQRKILKKNIFKDKYYNSNHFDINLFDYNFFIKMNSHLKNIKTKESAIDYFKNINNFKNIIYNTEQKELYEYYDWNEYINSYNDLKKNIKNYDDGFKHYLFHGINENRKINNNNLNKSYTINNIHQNYNLPPDFNVKNYYLNYYNELKDFKLNDLKRHYINIGLEENRVYNVNIYNNKYCTNYLDNHINYDYLLNNSSKYNYLLKKDIILNSYFHNINIYFKNNITIKNVDLKDKKINYFNFDNNYSSMNEKLLNFKDLFINIDKNNLLYHLIIINDVAINNCGEINNLNKILEKNNYFDIIELTYTKNKYNFYEIIESTGCILNNNDYDISNFDCFIITNKGIQKVLRNLNLSHDLLIDINIGFYSKPIFNKINDNISSNNNILRNDIKKMTIDINLWKIFYNVTSYWDKIYCINLNIDVEKKYNMKKYLHILNSDKNNFFYDGILGKTLPSLEKLIDLNLYNRASLKQNLKIGTIGLNITQQTIIKEAYEKNYNNILLLEDDIDFNYNYFITLHKLFEIYQNIDVLYLGYSRFNNQDLTLINKIDDINIYQPKNIFKKVRIGGLFAVILSKKAIKIFYDNIKTLDNITDIYLTDIVFNSRQNFSDNMLIKTKYNLNTFYMDDFVKVQKYNGSLTEDHKHYIIELIKNNKFIDYFIKIKKLNFLNKHNFIIKIYLFDKASKYYSNIINLITKLFNSYKIVNEYNENTNLAFFCYEDNVNINNNVVNICLNGEKEDKHHDSDIGIVCAKKNFIYKYNIYFPQLFSSLYERRNNFKEIIFKNKTKFCAYMYSYDLEYRVNLYNYISSYKKVDSLGKSCNNDNFEGDRSIYNENITYNDIAVEKYSDYKFVLSLENGIEYGYITEKLINPIIAGSIPIYAGPEDAFSIINKERVIYIYDFTDYNELLEYIKKIDNDDELYNSIIRKDIFISDLNFDTFENNLLLELKKSLGMYPKTILINNEDRTYYYKDRNIDMTINNLPDNLNMYKIDNWLYDYINKGDTIKLNTIVSKFLNNIKFYLINLDHRQDRYFSCLDQFDKIGLINVERFSAIKPTMDEINSCSFIDKTKLWKNDTNYIIGASGCKLSHYNILKKALLDNKDNKYVCIFEDDIVFEDNTIINLIKSINYIENKNIDFDILYLSVNLTKKEEAEKINDHLLKLKGGLTTTAQIFQTKNLEKIIKVIEKSNAEIDNTYRDYLIEKYCVYPMCTYQKNSYSDINNKDVAYTMFHKKFEY